MITYSDSLTFHIKTLQEAALLAALLDSARRLDEAAAVAAVIKTANV
jgi:hypothetical protein